LFVILASLWGRDMAKNEQKIKVIIGMPVNGKMIARTTHAVGTLILHSSDKIIDFLLYQTCDIVSGRTWIVNQAMEKGATHLLFIDSDMVFAGDVLEIMLAHKKEIMGVEYNQRSIPKKPTHKPLDEASDKELYKADYVGGGLLLIDLSIIPKLKGPWFNFGRDSQGTLVMGEDVWFCRTARDAGFDTWIDPKLKVGHIGEFVY
jgi:hypothetical protein